MDCKDLTVCDFVKHDGTIKIVDAVYLCSVSVHDSSKPWGVALSKLVHVDDIEPIPLTEEILAKNSDFTVRGEYVISGKHRNPYLRIAWSRDKEKFYFSTLGSNCYLDCVHQLQHLLRLVGIKKEVQL